MMKLGTWGLLVVGILLPSASSAYRRFSYVAHNFTLPTRDTSSLLDDMVKNNVLEIKRSATYALKYNEIRRDFVYLSRLDKWRIARALRMYTAQTVLTPVLIDHIVGPLWGKRKVVVRHVLQDLTKQQSVTVGHILHTLGIEMFG